MYGKAFNVSDWCWFTRRSSPCRVIERQDVWGEVVYRVWLPAKDYKTIISIANKLPEETLQEDEKLLTLYDLALTRMQEK